METETRKRSIIKTITWRVLAYIITALTAYLFTRKLTLSLGIGFTDTGIKTLIYYGHERLWQRIKFGRKNEHPEDYMI